MPGTIITILKKVGDKVAEGEVVCILEAMKMENEVVAAISGTVGQVLVTKGSVVKTGDPLVLIH
jgi:acetyl-CoA/propionyl-CoA carboxylase biotin carboxyl carrier protein